MFKKMAFLASLLALGLAACAPAAPSTDSRTDYFSSGGGDAAYEEPSAPPQDGAAATGNTDQDKAAGSANRLVIKNAQLTVVVNDPGEALKSFSQLADSYGGYVVTSNTYQASVDAEGKAILRGNLTIRIPSERLTEALTQIKAQVVEVRSENVSGQDVTAEYTDLESRLRNLEATEAALQEIMEAATKTEDVLTVYNQLAAIRGEIEMVKGQMKYYADAAALSSITLDLVPNALNQPLQVAGWRPEGTAKAAVEALIRTLQSLADLVISFTIFCLPLGLLFGLPAFFVGRWAWKQWRKPGKAA